MDGGTAGVRRHLCPRCPVLHHARAITQRFTASQAADSLRDRNPIKFLLAATRVDPGLAFRTGPVTLRTQTHAAGAASPRRGGEPPPARREGLQGRRRREDDVKLVRSPVHFCAHSPQRSRFLSLSAQVANTRVCTPRPLPPPAHQAQKNSSALLSPGDKRI